MRRAMPQPWSGPSTSSVFRTMSARVPCRTSVSFMLFGIPKGSMPPFLWESNRTRRHDGPAKAGHSRSTLPDLVRQFVEPVQNDVQMARPRIVLDHDESLSVGADVVVGERRVRA